VKILLDDDIAAICKVWMFVTDNCSFVCCTALRIFCAVDEPDDIAIIEIAEAVNLVGNRNYIADVVHDLCGQFKTAVGVFGSNVKEDVTRSGNGMAAA
jgi:hypothetical protein